LKINKKWEEGGERNPEIKNNLDIIKNKKKN